MARGACVDFDIRDGAMRRRIPRGNIFCHRSPLDVRSCEILFMNGATCSACSRIPS